MHYAKLAAEVSPPNTVCVTALPCKVFLIMTLVMFAHVYYYYYIADTKRSLL